MLIRTGVILTDSRAAIKKPILIKQHFLLTAILRQTKGHPAEKLVWCCSMATLSSLPRTLQDWIQKLDSVSLPALANDCQQARLALTEGERSLREIAQMIQATPVLALQIMREANRSTYSQNDRAESLEAALTRIGLTRARELLDRIPIVSINDENRPFFQILLISQHASQQASGLFSLRLARLWQEVHWNSLLFLAPVWALVGAYPKLFGAWEQHVMAKGESSRRAETELLGLPVLSLCLALARHWQLPDWIVEGYRILNEDQRFLVKALHIALDNEHPLHQQQELDEDPELRRWLTIPDNTPLLANSLAITAHHGWSTVRARRWQQLTALYLQQPLPELQQQVHQHAVSSARQHATPGLWHPAQALLWPWNSRFSSSEKLTATSFENESIRQWRECCMELVRDPCPFANILQLTATAKDAFLACGMQRVLLLQLDPKRDLLVTRQASGLGSEAGFLQLDPVHNQLLKHLLENPRQLHLAAEHAARLFGLLPGALKSLFTDSQHLLLRSLASNGRVVMLAIADLEGAELSDTDLQGFSKTAQCLERALDHYGKRER